MKHKTLRPSYLKSPRLTFVLRHPKAAVMTLLAHQGLRHSRTLRRGALTLVGIGVGIGAASVAVPVLAGHYMRASRSGSSGASAASGGR